MVASLCFANAGDGIWDRVYQRAAEGFACEAPILVNGHPFTEGGKPVSGSQLEMALHELVAFGHVTPADVVDGLSSDRMFVRYACVFFINHPLKPLSDGAIQFDGHWMENPAETEEGRKAIERCRQAMAGYGKMPELISKLREGVFWRPRNRVEAR